MSTGASELPAPDTVAEAVHVLERLGYLGDPTVVGSVVDCDSCGRSNTPEQLRIRHRFRFEGPSDPADEAVVLGVECPSCGSKGILVSAYGPFADGDLLDVVGRISH